MLAISASGDGLFIVAGSQPGEEPRRTVTLDDDETQSYGLALAPGAAPREDAPFEVTVRADPVHVDDSKTLTLQIDDDDYSLDTDVDEAGAQLSGTLHDSPSFAAEITPPANDGNRTEDTVTGDGVLGDGGQRHRGGVSRLRGGRRPRATRAGAAVARDAAGRAVTSVSEGGAVELTVSVNRGRGAAAATGEALSVAASPRNDPPRKIKRPPPPRGRLGERGQGELRTPPPNATAAAGTGGIHQGPGGPLAEAAR